MLGCLRSRGRRNPPLVVGATRPCTDAVAVVVSESSVVRMFDDGELVGEVIPELWMMNRYRSQINAPVSRRSDEEVTVLSKVGS